MISASSAVICCCSRRRAGPDGALAERRFPLPLSCGRVTERKSFGSDNHAGAHPAVLRMLAEASAGDEMPYGADSWSARAAAELRARFGAAGAFFVFNGTGANVLGLSLLLRPIDAVICAETAHINVDECGAPERVLGTKLLPVPTRDGKLTPDLIAGRLAERGDEHRPQPRVVAISQVTELGTCYTLEELGKLGDFCRASGLLLYIDGARLANAAAYLGCDLADLAEQADVLSFGGTKNGAVGAEAVLVMDEDIAAAVPFHRKQLLQLGSKLRFLAAQFAALLADDLWLRNASHANTMARRLADRIGGLPGVELRQPVESNAVFASLDPRHIPALQEDWRFHVWDEQDHVVRLMAAFDTTEDDVDALAAAIAAATAGGSSPEPGRPDGDRRLARTRPARPRTSSLIGEHAACRCARVFVASSRSARPARDYRAARRVSRLAAPGFARSCGRSPERLDPVGFRGVTAAPNTLVESGRVLAEPVAEPARGAGLQGDRRQVKHRPRLREHASRRGAPAGCPGRARSRLPRGPDRSPSRIAANVLPSKHCPGRARQASD